MVVLALLGFSPAGALAAPGDLDPSFGTGGTVSTNIGPGTEDYAGDVAIDSDGNVVVAGSSETGPETASAAVARYTPSGALDPTFGGGDGIVTFHFGSGESDYVRAVAIDSSNRITLAGFSGFDYAVARLTASGQLDPTFGGGDGTVITHVGGIDRSNAVIIDGSGRIVLGGEDFTLLRYTASGTLDPSFGGDGIVQTTFEGGQVNGLRELSLDTHGRIIAAGGSGDLALARYLENGTLDKTFSGDGRVVTTLDGEDYASGAALDSHNRIVIAGSSFSCVPYCRFLVRYTPSGKLDSTFGGDGVVMGPSNTLAESLAIDGSDRPLITGHVSGLPGHEEGLLRYLPDGSLDPAFGGGDGIAPEPLGIVEALAVDSSQRIVAAGSEVGSPPDVADFAAARFVGGGPPPPAQHLITVETVGTGAGTVASTPAGIDCGTTCVSEFGSGEVVTLTATPAGGADFAGWAAVSGDPGTCTGTTSPCQVTVDEYTELEASFDGGPLPEYTLTITKSGSGTGSVASSPTGIDCGPACSFSFEEGAEVTLNAIPSANSVFAGWSGGGCFGTGSCQVTMTADTTITASFNGQPSGGDENNQSSEPPVPAAHAEAPSTKLGKAIIKGRSQVAIFMFSASGEGRASFRCKLDKGPFKPCRSPKTYRNLKSGRHVFRVQATDALGQTDTTPVVKRFRIPQA